MKWIDKKTSLMVNKKSYTAGMIIPAGVLTPDQVKRFGDKIQHEEPKIEKKVFIKKPDVQILEKKTEPEFVEITVPVELTKAERKAKRKAEYEAKKEIEGDTE